MLNASQSYDWGYDVTFNKYRCEIRITDNGILVVVGIRTFKYLYTLI